MFGSSIIEVGIGLVLMYFLLSLMCTTITELITRFVNMRAKTLAEGIRSLLKDPDSVKEVGKYLSGLRKAIETLNDPEATGLFQALGASPQLKQTKQFEKDIERYLKAHSLSGQKRQEIETRTQALGDAIRSRSGDIQMCLAALGTQIEALDDRKATRLFEALETNPELTQMKQFEKGIVEYLEAASLDTHIQKEVSEKTKVLGRIVRLNSFSESEFYAHPLIARLGSQERSRLARFLGQRTPKASKDEVIYISPRDFGLVLLDLLAPSPDNNKTKILVEVGKSIQALPDGDLKTSLTALLVGAEGDLTKLREGIERWFNDSMDAVQGWYRRKAQLITLGIALIVTVAANADTLTVADKLSRDAAFRTTVVAAATKIAEQPPVVIDGKEVTSTQKIQDLQNVLVSLDYPIGWRTTENQNDPQRWPPTRTNLPNKVIGLLLTWLLISLGAPFWYDMLNKLVNLRAAGKPPETTTKP